MRNQIQSIICATDFSDYSNQVFHYGVVLAREFDAMIYACHVLDPPPASIYYEAYIDPVKHQELSTGAAQKEFAKLIDDPNIKWKPIITMGHTADEIHRITVEVSADMVIVATHGRSGLKRLILGSVTERLMRILHCPLLIVRDTETHITKPDESKLEFKRILVGCDFSSDSQRAFEYALRLAQEFQSELFLAHVVERPVYMESIKASKVLKDDLFEDVQARIKEKLLEMIPSEASNWCKPTTIVFQGKPHELLTDYAKSNEIDLIVLGVRGHGLVEELFVGSTTDRVARNAPCPILSVSPIVRI